MYDNSVMSPGHGVYLPGAVNNSLNIKEYLLVYKFCMDLFERVKDKIYINLIWDDVSKTVADNLNYLVKTHKKYDLGNGKTLHIFVHANAGGGTGVEVIYKNNKLKVLADNLSYNSSVALGLKNRGGKVRNDLRMLNSFSHSLLPELMFLDNKGDVDSFYKNYNKLLDVYEDFLIKNVKNKKEVVKKENVKKEEVVDVCKCNGKYLSDTARKEYIELIKKAVKEGVFTSPHTDVANYSDSKLEELVLIYFIRVNRKNG